MMNDVSISIADYESVINRQQAVIRELWAMLERRQRCDDCGGSGAVPDWISDEDGGCATIEPCECWGDAEAAIEKYRKEYGDE